MAKLTWFGHITTYKMARLPIPMQAQQEKNMSKAIETLRAAAEKARRDAKYARNDARNHQAAADASLADALDYDNRAIDMEDAITKLEEGES